MAKGDYVRPRSIFMGGEQKKLYRLEEHRNKALRACAEEWATIEKVPREEYWIRTLPQALYDLLGSLDREAAAIAAVAYLENEGYTTAAPPVQGQKRDGND